MPRARPPYVDLKTFSDGGNMMYTGGEVAFIYCGVKHKQPYCLSLILTSLTPFFLL